MSGDMARFKNAVERLVDAFREFVPISALSRLAGPIATAHAELTALYQQAQKWKQYAQHALDCPAHPLIIEGAPDAPCDCGLDAVIVSTQPARPEDNG